MGTKAMTRGHGGNRLRCLRLVSGLDVKDVKDVLYKYDSVTAFTVFQLLASHTSKLFISLAGFIKVQI